MAHAIIDDEEQFDRSAETLVVARESGKPIPKEPLFWLKAPTSLLPDGGKIEIPFPSHRTEFEAELAIVVGRRIPGPTVARTPVHWAILAGVGAGFFASAFVTVARKL